jgi:hypothetical protein
LYVALSRLYLGSMCFLCARGAQDAVGDGSDIMIPITKSNIRGCLLGLPISGKCGLGVPSSLALVYWQRGLLFSTRATGKQEAVDQT